MAHTFDLFSFVVWKVSCVMTDDRSHAFEILFFPTVNGFVKDFFSNGAVCFGVEVNDIVESRSRSSIASPFLISGGLVIDFFSKDGVTFGVAVDDMIESSRLFCVGFSSRIPSALLSLFAFKSLVDELEELVLLPLAKILASLLSFLRKVVYIVRIVSLLLLVLLLLLSLLVVV